MWNKAAALAATSLLSFPAALTDCGSNDLPELSGQVTAADRCATGPYSPVERAKVTVFRDGNELTSTLTDAGGYYLFRLNPGPYHLVIYPPSDWTVEYDVVMEEDANLAIPVVQAESIFAPREVLVGFYPGVSEARIVEIGGEVGVVEMEKVSAIDNWWWMLLAEEEHVTEGMTDFGAYAETEFTEPNYYACPDAGQ